ncbi:MAG TPA: radical SAM/SPASM family putative metalloenzyme maturase, partial [Nitrospirota bacterium]|nr:radical SAM/SPASM family putative metalloenzyme maturase [Nitrospirota bacterium]
ISVDAAQPEIYRSLRSGGSLNAVEQALFDLRAARQNHRNAVLQIGIEFVAMRDNLLELPRTVQWAARHGASFVIVSHLLPYDRAMAEQTLFDANTDSAVELFRTWKEKARNKGCAIERYPEVYLKYEKTEEEHRIVALVEEMKNDAVSRGIFLHLDKLFSQGDARAREVEAIFDEARAVALKQGIELHLPLAVPKSVRKCEFVEEGGAFISQDGNVHPCYFLWHRYRCYIDGHEKHVRPQVFGNLHEHDLVTIWNLPGFRSFRENVVSYDYPYCFNCSFALCDYVQHEDFHQDCYVNTEPCGACLWCMGVFHCLR